MKSKFLRMLLSCVLIVAILVSCVACNAGSNDLLNNNSANNSNANANNSYDDGADTAITNEEGYTFSKTDRVSYQGTHIRNITESSTDFIKGGKTEYTLVMPQTTTKTVSEMKADFLLLFKKATGITLSVRLDVDVVNDWSVEKKYISVGETLLVEKAQISKDEYSIDNIKTEGIRIITKGNTQFLLGGDQFGVVNAMYEFLTIYFNFDCYHRSGIELDTGVSDLKFKNIDLTEIPDVEHYSGDYNKYGWELNPEPIDVYALGTDTYRQEVSVYNHRLRAHSANNPYLKVDKEFVHNESDSPRFHTVNEFIPVGSDLTIPDDIWKYRDQIGFKNTDPHIPYHADMYEKEQKQFCFTAHGNQDIYDDMVDLCAAKVIFSLMHYNAVKYPQFKYITITIEDNQGQCVCASCLDAYSKYLSSGTTVRFINKVGEIVDKWLKIQADENAEFHDSYREEFKILTFAYLYDELPPVNVTVNSDGSKTYTPMDPSVKLTERTAIFLTRWQGTAIYDSLHGPGLDDVLPGWDALKAPNGGHVFWYNSPSVFSRDYAYDELTQYNNDFWQTIAYYGYEDVFMDHFSGGIETSGWKTLFSYLCSKLRWDSNANIDELIKKFMNGMYYEAADIMYQLYEDMRLYYVNIRANSDDPNSTWQYVHANAEKYYPYPVLEAWINSFELAKAKIAHYQETDPDLYITIKTRIEIEEAGELVKAIYLYGGKTNRPFTIGKLNEYRKLIIDLSELTPKLSWQGSKVSEYV